MLEHVDPFIGTSATDLPEPRGLAATWWWPKPQVGNTHPGATYPFGMVSACAYSGAYPTGYGLYDLNTEGVPPRIHENQIASGFTHFQQSGTGAIRKYYNYFRVTPMLEPLDALGTTWDLVDEHAEPGYYRARLSSGIACELTVGPKSAVHRYTFPEHADARVVVDFSMGGLTIPYGSTVPLRAHLQALGPGVAQAETVVEGAPLAAHIECEPGDWRQLLWYDRRLMHGGTRLDLDRIRQTTLRPFGLMWRGRSEPGHVLELRFGFSLRGAEQARQNLFTDCPPGHASFKARRRKTSGAWKAHLGKVEIETRNPTRQTVFATALYHSLIKPCFAPDESPFWRDTPRGRRSVGRSAGPSGSAVEEGLRPRDWVAGRFGLYEGGKWNYSFRLLPDMDSRIQLAGGADRFLEKLDAFFGYGAEPVQQVGERPSVDELADGFALDRFQGLNNEPDMEAPWCYHYLGRPDRTAEVVHAALTNQFGLGRGGLPGNDDSGGLSSWYVWASLGLFPVAGQNLYLLNAPSVRSARLVLGATELALETSGFVEPQPDRPVQYVQSVTFNGEPLDGTWLPASAIHSGGELHFKLGPEASGWGRSSRPPSISAREEPG